MTSRIATAPHMAFIGLLLALLATGHAQATQPNATLDFGDGYDELVRNLAVSPDGKFIAVYRDRELDRAAVTLWDVAGRKQVATIRLGDWAPTGDFAFSPDGKYLTVCAWRAGDSNKSRSTAVFWDLATLKESRRVNLDQGPGRPTIFTPDGKSMITCTADQDIVVVSLESGKQLKALKSDNPRKDVITTLAVSPDGKTVAAGRLDVLLLFDLQKGELLRKIEAPKELVESIKPKGGGVSFEAMRLLDAWPWVTDMLAFSPDGKRLVSARRVDYKVQVWDPATGKNLDVLRFENRDRVTQVSAVAFSPDGATLALGCSNSKVELWDVAQFGYRGDFLGRSRSGYEIAHLVFTPDGKTLITASNRVEIWAVPAGAPKSVVYP